MATKHALEYIVWLKTNQVTAIRENTETGRINVHNYHNVNPERLEELADIGNYHRGRYVDPRMWIVIRADGWSINTPYRNASNY